MNSKIQTTVKPDDQDVCQGEVEVHARRYAILRHIETGLSSHSGRYVRTACAGSVWYHTTEHGLYEGGLYYNNHSPSRYSDPSGKTGVAYLASQDFVSVAEVYNAMPDDENKLNLAKLYKFKACRDLKLFDITACATELGVPPEFLIRPANDNEYGYALTQGLAQCLLHKIPNIDGLTYRSAKCDSATSNYSNVVLFSGRRQQVYNFGSCVSLAELELSNGYTVCEFLARRKTIF